MKPYVIVSPDFDTTSGGIRVMWGLFGWLLAKGQVAFMNRRPDGDVIAIYPEIAQGNPAEAKTVVRYILAPLGEMSSNGVPGPLKYPDTDLIYSFSKLIYKTDNAHTMFLPIINLHQFYDQGKKRTKRAVFFGKKPNTGLHPKDCVAIDRTFAHDQRRLADLLNECEVLYSYDHRSAMFEIARLCGCRVVIFPSNYTKKEFELYEPGMNGITWGPEPTVKLDTKAFRQHYKNMIKTFSRKLDGFIEDTQN